MNLSYPVVFERSTNEVIIRVVDISEANTFGDNKAHALIEVEDALSLALLGCVSDEPFDPRIPPFVNLALRFRSL